MIRNHSLWLLTFLWLPVAGLAQQDDATVPLQFRAVLHDPVHPAADLFYTDRKGVVVKLDFRPQDLTRPLFTLPLNGSLVLYRESNFLAIKTHRAVRGKKQDSQTDGDALS